MHAHLSESSLTCDWHVAAALLFSVRSSREKQCKGSSVFLLSASHQLSRLNLSSSGYEGVSPSERNVEIQPLVGVRVCACVCVCVCMLVMFIHTQCHGAQLKCVYLRLKLTGFLSSLSSVQS